MTRYRWQQGERLWEVNFDRHRPLPGDLAQRTWLALAALYDEQGRPADGIVYYSLPRLGEILGVRTSSGDNRDRLALAVEQIDGIRIYVTGPPLAGPPGEAIVPVTGRAARRQTQLYSFIGGRGVSAEPETGDHQLYLIPPRGFSRRPSNYKSARALSSYVVESLRGQGGRIVPEFVFGLKSAYAVRLTRLLGKRANGQASLVIRPESLLPALPALGPTGDLLTLRSVGRTLERAHDELARHGFLRDVTLEDGRFKYRFGSPFVAIPVELSEFGESTVDELVAALGRPDNRAYYTRCVAELGSDRVRAALTDARAARVPNSDLARVLGANLERMRVEQTRRHEEELADFRRSSGADTA